MANNLVRRPAAPEVSLKGQWFFLIIGLAPLVMLVQFWLRSGTGLNPSLVGFVMLYAGSFLAALNYFFFYQQNKPRSAILPPGPLKALGVAAILLGLGVFNMLGTVSGVNLTLSPGPRIESSQLAPTVAKVLLLKKVEAPPRKRLNLRATPWLVSGTYLRGSLWGALGYALAFGIAGALFGLLRKEVMDPRDEHMGAGMLGAFVRAAVGLFYGTSMGFAAGACLIFVLRTLFPNFAVVPGAILHWVYVLGAASNPNVAFSYAFSTACLLAGAMSLFLGRGDFTAGISDPKAPELTRPVEIVIPAVPAAPAMAFDAGRMQAESQQMLAQFQAELTRTISGPEWQFERYDLPTIGARGAKPEPASTHVISARAPEEDSYETAMGSLSDVYVQIVADLGKLEISAADWLTLAEGAMLELPRSPDGLINVAINGKPVGKGRALTLNGNKAVKVITLKGDVQQLVGS